MVKKESRINAIVRFGKAVEMGVKFGLNPRAFTIIDSGATRSAGDSLSIVGLTNSNAKASITKFYMQFSRGKFIDRGGIVRTPFSITEVVVFAEEHAKRLEEVYAFIKKIYKDFTPIPSRYLGALYWTLSDIDAEAANSFFELYGTGIGLTQRHPVYVLRTKLMSDMNSIKKYPTTDKLLWFVMAWNYYRQGRTVTQLRYNDKTEFPKPI